MPSPVSVDQPFLNFLDNPTAHGPLTAPVPGNKDAAPAPLAETPLAGAFTPNGDALQLSNDLRKDLKGKLGPESTKRTVARAHTAPSLLSPKKPAPPVTTFELYKLEEFAGKKSGKAETAGEKAARVDANFSKLADVVAMLDGRVAKLTREHENLVTEYKLGAQDGRGDSRSPAGDTSKKDDTFPAPHTPSPAPSSVAGYEDNGDEICARLDELDHKIDDIIRITENQAVDLETVERRTTTPFTITQLSDAVKLQFKTITSDRDAVIEMIQSNASKQAKINNAHDVKVAELERELRQVRATIARLELAPAAPLALRSRSRSMAPRSRSRSPPARNRSRSPLARARSRSPADGQAAKRHRPAAETERERDRTIVMGPLEFGKSMVPVEAFQLHIDTALPNYDTPTPFRITVYREGNYIHVVFPSVAEAQALIRAWSANTVEGYKSIKMVLESADRGPREAEPRTQNARASGSGHRSSSGSYRGGRGGAGGGGGKPASWSYKKR
ncbi:hypothetical protein C8R44DRAFT_980649 [Mycena epipterygia]|nr:hypothetical protein C8R44DRAFT_980649 [Mycena epipterygia]